MIEIRFFDILHYLAQQLLLSVQHSLSFIRPNDYYFYVAIILLWVLSLIVICAGVSLLLWWIKPILFYVFMVLIIIYMTMCLIVVIPSIILISISVHMETRSLFIIFSLLYVLMLIRAPVLLIHKIL